jgi:geranylgeranyl reductase family protein
MLEEHRQVGEPVQCAGLITPRCFDILEHARDTIINSVRGADIHSPAGSTISIGKKEMQACVIDRAAFDRRILDMAVDSGATLIPGKRIAKFARQSNGTISLNNGDITAKLVIGADGARSATRNWAGLDEPIFMLNGFSADVSGLDMDPDRVRIFFGRNIAPNFFAWMIPAGDIVRVGLCIRDCQGTVHDHFKNLFTKGPASESLRGGTIRTTHSGQIPLGTLPATHADNMMLLGDAACQVKATSGGGIYPGLVCASHCAQTAMKALESGNFTARFLSEYHSAWTSGIGAELDRAMMMHRIYSSLDDKQLEDIFRMMQNPEILEIINAVGDIDYPSKLAWTLLRKEPGLLKYAGKFLKHGMIGR